MADQCLANERATHFVTRRCGLCSALEWCWLDRLFDTFAHLLAGPKMRNTLFRNRYGGPRFWISPDACRAVVQAETAEATNFNAITSNQRATDAIQYFLDGDVCILRHELGEAVSEGGDKIGACHAHILHL